MDSNNTPIKFDIYSGPQLTRTEILTGPTIKIGKLAASHLRLDDDTVSRMHANIEVRHPNDIVLLDLGSAYGTLVNEQRVTRVQLKSGDRIKFGEVNVVVTIAGQTVAQSMPQRSSSRAAFLRDQTPDTHGRMLEIYTIWNRVVIDMDSITDVGQYFIGSDPDADQYLPDGLLPNNYFPIAAKSDEETMYINVPDHIEGEVMFDGDGKVFRISDLREKNKLQASTIPGCQRLPLLFRARCRLSMGNFAILINSVPTPPPSPPLSITEVIDQEFVFSALSVAALMATIMLLISLIPVSPDSLDLDRLESIDRFIQITLDAEEKIEEKKKDGGSGAKKAAKSEGQMGKKDTPEVDKKYQVKGTETGDPEVIRARKQAVAQAMVDDIFSAVDSGLLDGSQSAVALGALEGFNGSFRGAEAGNAFGMGGLGSVGTGMGGGGDGQASFGLGGLSTVGGGGGGRGRGRGYGNGAANLGSRRAKKPKVILMNAKVERGSLPREVIRRVIQSRAGGYQNCYERQLQAKRDLNGKIEVKITIAKTGRVLMVKVSNSTMHSPPVENCVLKQLKMLRFPSPENGKPVIVSYPFRFKRS